MARLEIINRGEEVEVRLPDGKRIVFRARVRLGGCWDEQGDPQPLELDCDVEVEPEVVVVAAEGEVQG